LFHDQSNKAWALDQFRNAPPESGRVLVASGLYEGIDLPYDMARWQLIGKIPYLSLGDARIAAKAKEYPDWYQWEAIKRVIQAAGRIVRTPTDYGVTYISDTSFARLWDQDGRRDNHLFPNFFKSALRDKRKHKT
jgi:Rad3-related DNA helicase